MAREADVQLALAQQESIRANRAADEEANRMAQKRGFFGGLGRVGLGLLGMAVMPTLAPGILAKFGPAATRALGAGIGSLGGSVIARGLAGRYKSPEDTLFYTDETENIRKRIADTRRNEITNSIQRSFLDAATGYMTTPTPELGVPQALLPAPDPAVINEFVPGTNIKEEFLSGLNYAPYNPTSMLYNNPMSYRDIINARLNLK